MAPTYSWPARGGLLCSSFRAKAQLLTVVSLPWGHISHEVDTKASSTRTAAWLVSIDLQLASRPELVIRVLTKSGSEQLQGRVRQVDAEVALASPLLQEGLERWHPLGGEVGDDQATDALQIHPLLEHIHCSHSNSQEIISTEILTHSNTFASHEALMQPIAEGAHGRLSSRADGLADRTVHGGRMGKVWNVRGLP